MSERIMPRVKLAADLPFNEELEEILARDTNGADPLPHLDEYSRDSLKRLEKNDPAAYNRLTNWE